MTINKKIEKKKKKYMSSVRNWSTFTFSICNLISVLVNVEARVDALKYTWTNKSLVAACTKKLMIVSKGDNFDAT